MWMMRQAGRHMQVYRDLCAKYPTFRERSEIPEVSLEISLQPWRAYKTDGVILFSDILSFSYLLPRHRTILVVQKLGALYLRCRNAWRPSPLLPLRPSLAPSLALLPRLFSCPGDSCCVRDTHYCAIRLLSMFLKIRLSVHESCEKAVRHSPY